MAITARQALAIGTNGASIPSNPVQCPTEPCMSLDSHPSSASAQRIRLARRTAGLSQAQLALELGVQRSAVSHWEAQRGKPSMNHLRQLALLTGVQFEWLATGRGAMTPSADTLDRQSQRMNTSH